MSIAVFFFLALTGCGGKGTVPKRKGPSLTIRKTHNPPVVDGILDDECWKNARSETLKLSKGSGKPKYPTTVRAVYDSLKLYVCFECQDPDAASSIIERDGPVATQECVSIFIDAGGDSTSYAVIDIAPTGAFSDAFVISYRDGELEQRLSCWDCEGLRVSVSVTGGGSQYGTEDRFWTVECALPLSSFLMTRNIPPKPNDAWRVNFTRADMTKGDEYSALIPTGSDQFNKPSSYAWLIFGE